MTPEQRDAIAYQHASHGCPLEDDPTPCEFCAWQTADDDDARDLAREAWADAAQVARAEQFNDAHAQQDGAA